jgi:hypothetical protein
MKIFMKVTSLLFISLCIATVSVADTNTSIVPTVNISTQTPHEKEISQLKKHVQALEDELAGYKKVKPVGSKIFVPQKIAVPKAVSEQKKFVFSKDAPSELSVYYSAGPQTISDVIWKLETNGFTVLAQDQILEVKRSLPLPMKH